MSASIGHERQLTFFPTNGHNHDGENSTIVDLQPGQVDISHLNESVLEYLRDALGSGGTGGTGNSTEDQLVPIPDLEIETNSIGAGATLTGSVEWVGMAVVRAVRIVMSAETECTITFYHKGTYAEEDREFRAQRCSNKFLWEGPWVHWDEGESNQIHYKIQNTGTAAARFNISLKAGTLVANAYANFVSGLQKLGSELDPFIGAVTLQEGNGVRITPDAANNSFTIDAVPAEAVTIDRYALVMRMPVSYTGSTTTSGGPLQSDFNSTTNVNFGTGPQWIVMDYGANYNVGRIVIVPYFDRGWYDIKIEVSSDSNTWVTLLDQVPGPIITGRTGVIVETPTGYPVRYVRWHSNGSTVNTTNHLIAAVIYEIKNKVGT